MVFYRKNITEVFLVNYGLKQWHPRLDEATWPSWRCPCLWQRGWNRWLWEDPNPSHQSQLGLGGGTGAGKVLAVLAHPWGTFMEPHVLPVTCWAIAGDEGGQGRAGSDPQPPKLTGEGAAELGLRGGLALRGARVLLLGLGERGASVPWEMCSQHPCPINQPSATPKDPTPIRLTFPCENKQQNIRKRRIATNRWRVAGNICTRWFATR